MYFKCSKFYVAALCVCYFCLRIIRNVTFNINKLTKIWWKIFNVDSLFNRSPQRSLKLSNDATTSTIVLTEWREDSICVIFSHTLFFSNTSVMFVLQTWLNVKFLEIFELTEIKQQFGFVFIITTNTSNEVVDAVFKKCIRLI